MHKRTRKIVVAIFMIFNSLAFAGSGLQTRQFLTHMHKSVLENGLPLIYEWDESSHVTVLQLFIKGGQHAEPEGKAGLAYITTRLSLEIPDQSKTQELMNQATRIYMACKEDFSHITLSCLSENLENALEVMSKILSKPLFSGIRIDRIKDRMERQQNREADEPFNQAHETYMNAFFKGSPYANSVYGDEKSRKATKKKDIQLYYQKYFTAKNMVLVVSSDLPKEEITALMNTYLGVFPEGSPAALVSYDLAPEVQKTITIEKDSQQSYISAGYFIDGSSPRNYIHALLINNLLGKGVNSRLWELRIKDKLAYNVNSRFTFTREGILLEAFLETENAKREAAQQALQETLQTLFSDGINEEELTTTKVFAKSLLLRDNETKENRSRTLAFFEILGLGYDFIDEIFAQIDATTPEELNAFLQTYLKPEKAIFVVVGPST